jgi:hypothetical protein
MESSLYDEDFYEWTMKNAELMRQGRFSEVDVENIAEELESMGRSERRELISRLTVLLTHLLKWQFQPDRRSLSWVHTINGQRRHIALLLEDSPSLARDIEIRIARAYSLAIGDAATETGISRKTFPLECPYDHRQIMDQEFWPNG